MNHVRSLLEAHFPGLHRHIEATLAEVESSYNHKNGSAPSEFLLEHSQRTAAIAHKIAQLEGVDPLLPVIVAFLHDAGKFHDGDYHQDQTPEEEHAAALAQAMLTQFGMTSDEIASVGTALRSLYDDRFQCAGPARIVQDADRLDKLGTLGICAFFTKAALRGRGLVDALAQTASRELTYALAAPRAMFTATGRRLADEHSARTVDFFDGLLADLETWGIASFERRTISLNEAFSTRDGASVDSMDVTIVMPRICPECAAALDLSHVRGRGLKCENLTAQFACSGCGYSRKTTFCLPVLA